MTNPAAKIIAPLMLAMLTAAASAQQRTIYDSRGNVAGRSANDSQGTTTTYDARGKVIGRASAAPPKNDWPKKDDCYGRPAMMSGKPCHQYNDPPEKITFGEMRAAGAREILIYCRDFRCGHHTEASADGWPDDVRLSDIEPRFICQRCGQRGAEVRPKFSEARMGTG